MTGIGMTMTGIGIHICSYTYWITIHYFKTVTDSLYTFWLKMALKQVLKYVILCLKNINRWFSTKCKVSKYELILNPSMSSVKKSLYFETCCKINLSLYLFTLLSLISTCYIFDFIQGDCAKDVDDVQLVFFIAQQHKLIFSSAMWFLIYNGLFTRFLHLHDILVFQEILSLPGGVNVLFLLYRRL